MSNFLQKMPLLRPFAKEVNFESYANWRSGHIKNGGCIVRWNGITVASIYAIVNADRELVLVICKGIFSKILKDDMVDSLSTYLYDKDKEDYLRGWNYIDTPLRA